MKDRPSTKDTLVINLRALMKAFKMTRPQLAQKSGVSDRMIAYIFAKERTPTVDVTEQLAKPFGLTSWQLIVPGITAALAKSGKLERLVNDYLASPDKGQEYINHVAEREAEYKTRK